MGEERKRSVRRSDLPVMVLIGLVATAGGIALGLAIDWFPVNASKQADSIDTLWDVLVIISVPIFVIVTCVVLYSVHRFRMQPGEEDLDGPPIHGNTKLEVVWTAIPAIIIAGLVIYAWSVLRDIERVPAAAAETEMKVIVHGVQFAWTFEYPGMGPGGKPVPPLNVVADFGGGAMHLNHSLGTHPALSTTFTHHEQALAMARDEESGSLAEISANHFLTMCCTDTSIAPNCSKHWQYHDRLSQHAPIKETLCDTND